MHLVRKWTGGALFATMIAAAVTSNAREAGTPKLPGTPESTGMLSTKRISGGKYAIDPVLTLVGWRVDHFGTNDFSGRLGNVRGTFWFDPEDPESAELSVTIPVDKVPVTNRGLCDHLLCTPTDEGTTASFLDLEPSLATYESAVVIASDDGTAQMDGNLTLNGVTKPVMIDVKFTGAGTNPVNNKETLGFEGTAIIDRSDFGIRYGLPMVSNAVELTITAAFEREAGFFEP